MSVSSILIKDGLLVEDEPYHHHIGQYVQRIAEFPHVVGQLHLQ